MKSSALSSTNKVDFLAEALKLLNSSDENAGQRLWNLAKDYTPRTLQRRKVEDPPLHAQTKERDEPTHDLPTPTRANGTNSPLLASPAKSLGAHKRQRSVSISVDTATSGDEKRPRRSSRVTTRAASALGTERPKTRSTSAADDSEYEPSEDSSDPEQESTSSGDEDGEDHENGSASGDAEQSSKKPGAQDDADGKKAKKRARRVLDSDEEQDDSETVASTSGSNVTTQSPQAKKFLEAPDAPGSTSKIPGGIHALSKQDLLHLRKNSDGSIISEQAVRSAGHYHEANTAGTGYGRGKAKSKYTSFEAIMKKRGRKKG